MPTVRHVCVVHVRERVAVCSSEKARRSSLLAVTMPVLQQRDVMAADERGESAIGATMASWKDVCLRPAACSTVSRRLRRASSFFRHPR